MTSKKLPTHVPRLDYTSHLLRFLALRKRSDRFIVPQVEPPVEEDEDFGWLDKPIHLSMVRNWIRGKPATQDPERWVIKRARTIFKQLTRHAQSNDKYRLGIVPGLFRHGELAHEDDETKVYASKAPRRAATGDMAMLVALEFDGVGTRWAREVHEALLEHRLAHAIYSTFSESTKSEYGFDTRCRLVLFPDRPLRTVEYTPVWKWWDLWLGEVADPAPKSIASVLYAPSHPTTDLARELAWATGAHGYRFDADEIVDSMRSWIRKRKPSGDRKLVGDLTNAGSLPETLAVDLTDGSRRTIGELEDGERFHAPDRDDEHASCTARIDDAGNRWVTDWSTARNWRVTPEDIVGIREALAESVSSRTKRDAKLNIEIYSRHVTLGEGSTAVPAEPSISVPVTLVIPDQLSSEALAEREIEEIVVEDERGILEALRRVMAPGVTAVLSAQPGVGKTQATVEYAVGVSSVRIVTPTVALARANATRFGAAFYGDVKHGEEPARLATTIHSRPKHERAYWLNVIDEFSSVLAEVHNTETNHGQNTDCYRALLHDLGTGAAIANSADLTLAQLDLLVRHVREVHGPRRFVVIKCRKIALPREIMYSKVAAVETHLFDVAADLEEARLAGVPLPAAFAGVDTVEEAEALAHELAARFLTMPVGMLHGETDHAPAANIDTWVEAHRGGFIIMTHAAAEGLSINVPISHVFGVHKFNQVPAQKFAQLLCRPRNVLDPVIVVGQPKWKDGARSEDAAIVRRDILAQAANDRAFRGHLWPGRVDKPVDCPEYLDARVVFECERNRAMNYPQVELAVARYGWPAMAVEAPGGLQPVNLEPARQAVREERDDRVLAAKDVDDVEATQIRHRPVRSREDRAVLDRKDVRDFYGDVTREILAMDKRGRGRRGFKTFAHARLLQRGGGRLVVAADLRARGEAHPALERHIATRADLLRRLWGVLSGGCKVGQDGVLRSETIGARGVAFVEDHRDEIVACGYRPPSPRGLHKWLISRMRELGAVLTLERQRRGGQIVRDYVVAWPEDWIVERYEAKLSEMVEAQELRDDLRCIREGAEREQARGHAA